MTNQEKLIKYIQNDYISEELCGLFLQLCNDQWISKGTLMDIVYGPDKGGKVDSALPEDYFKRVKEILPKVRSHYMVYDYNAPTEDDEKASHYGTFENVAERTIMKIDSLLRR